MANAATSLTARSLEIINLCNVRLVGKRDERAWIADEEFTWSAEIADINQASERVAGRVEAGDIEGEPDEHGFCDPSYHLYSEWCRAMVDGEEDYSIYEQED